MFINEYCRCCDKESKLHLATYGDAHLPLRTCTTCQAKYVNVSLPCLNQCSEGSVPHISVEDVAYCIECVNGHEEQNGLDVVEDLSLKKIKNMFNVHSVPNQHLLLADKGILDIDIP